MNLLKNSIILEKSMDFAVRIVDLYKYLCVDKRDFILSKQLLRSGTSIGANVHEAVYAQSRKDFVAKLSIALKEASETKYWLKLLRNTNYLTDIQYESINNYCSEVLKILTSIIKNSK